MLRSTLRRGRFDGASEQQLHLLARHKAPEALTALRGSSGGGGLSFGRSVGGVGRVSARQGVGGPEQAISCHEASPVLHGNGEEKFEVERLEKNLFGMSF